MAKVSRAIGPGGALIERSMAQGNLFAKVAYANLVYKLSPRKAVTLLREAADAGNEIAKRRLVELRQ